MLRLGDDRRSGGGMDGGDLIGRETEGLAIGFIGGMERLVRWTSDQRGNGRTGLNREAERTGCDRNRAEGAIKRWPLDLGTGSTVAMQSGG